ncbi:dihydrofolate reductase family protein [Polaromonas sp. P1(28)-8]|nr:dihydrofolate reductase family protein [Polaromonas sp. P1(28)-8]
MSRLRFKISTSLDGFVAGPHQSVENPLGISGGRLHEWAFQLAVFRALLGMEGGEVNESTPVVEESLANIGATVMGRNMFGGHPGPWDAKNPWKGWWGVNPPFHHPVFVLTHHARQAAGGKDVSLAGGANAARQYLAAGLVDEMEINLVPTLLGSGERLFEGIGDSLYGLDLVRTVAATKVTHLKYAKR